MIDVLMCSLGQLGVQYWVSSIPCDAVFTWALESTNIMRYSICSSHGYTHTQWSQDHHSEIVDNTTDVLMCPLDELCEQYHHQGGCLYYYILVVCLCSGTSNCRALIWFQEWLSAYDSKCFTEPPRKSKFNKTDLDQWTIPTLCLLEFWIP